MSVPIPVDHLIIDLWSLISFLEKNLQTGTLAYPLGEKAKATVIYMAGMS